MHRLVYFTVAALVTASTSYAGSGIGGVEFFGFGGLDVAAVRKALPVIADAPPSNEIKGRLTRTVRSVVGTDPTDIAVVCCDEAGNRWVYVGLAGTTSTEIGFRDEPRQPLRLSEELLLLHEKLEKALIGAVKRGGRGNRRRDVSRLRAHP